MTDFKEEGDAHKTTGHSWQSEHIPSTAQLAFLGALIEKLGHTGKGKELLGDLYYDALFEELLLSMSEFVKHCHHHTIADTLKKDYETYRHNSLHVVGNVAPPELDEVPGGAYHYILERLAIESFVSKEKTKWLLLIGFLGALKNTQKEQNWWPPKGLEVPIQSDIIELLKPAPLSTQFKEHLSNLAK